MFHYCTNTFISLMFAFLSMANLLLLCKKTDNNNYSVIEALLIFT
jgi:hypothetical protein